MTAHTIDEIIVQLDEEIALARREGSRLGFFATLYRNVTLKVREGIRDGFFEDSPRMERLDVTFASRYLDALRSHRQGRPTSACWVVSFEAAQEWRPIILQHLLLGMNAHINYDLGISAAEVCPGAELPALKADFDRINGVLAGMLAKVQEDVEELSPWIKFLDKVSDDKVEDAVINFSMGVARSCAWNVATRLASSNAAEAAPYLERLDRDVTRLGRLVRRPVGVFVRLGLLVIRLRESNDIPHTIDVLSQT
jgi:Family of unknown function (DUF5995)